jgi:hypothetical protein
VRARPRARHERDTLLSLPLHVVVRDYPEVLAVLRARGVEPGAAGGRSVARLLAEREDGDALLSAVLTALEWRPAR